VASLSQPDDFSVMLCFLHILQGLDGNCLAIICSIGIENVPMTLLAVPEDCQWRSPRCCTFWKVNI